MINNFTEVLVYLLKLDEMRSFHYFFVMIIHDIRIKRILYYLLVYYNEEVIIMFGEGFKVLLREIMSLSFLASFQVVLLVWWGFLVRVFRTS